jgi:ligand-binding SRPBCC domain-containing protein
MGMYQLKTEQKIPATIEEVWDFISSPRNLKHITPAQMGFEITNEPIADKMYTGMIISYKVAPILGIKMNWVTEITHVQDHEFFIDEQRLGPYTMWHHQHHIQPIDGGVIMKDIVSYIPPMGFLGDIANSIFIKSQLDAIFAFRHKAVDKYFGEFSLVH